MYAGLREMITEMLAAAAVECESVQPFQMALDCTYIS